MFYPLTPKEIEDDLWLIGKSEYSGKNLVSNIVGPPEFCFNFKSTGYQAQHYLLFTNSTAIFYTTNTLGYVRAYYRVRLDNMKLYAVGYAGNARNKKNTWFDQRTRRSMAQISNIHTSLLSTGEWRWGDRVRSLNCWSNVPSMLLLGSEVARIKRIMELRKTHIKRNNLSEYDTSIVAKISEGLVKGTVRAISARAMMYDN